ncbi:hypothetical protein BT63DRAFT_419026 [Microthyrium microscopicum]|uniref:Uncharacterized protein n=1 Tax=Microthyrium microscopicum TaxID=703497 RepID=A0A6A6TU34_9PEZI|nr:hypothetical protein BT63DRAFT_419026 [Microthyrium microscopicum]
MIPSSAKRAKPSIQANNTSEKAEMTMSSSVNRVTMSSAKLELATKRSYLRHIIPAEIRQMIFSYLLVSSPDHPQCLILDTTEYEPSRKPSFRLESNAQSEFDLKGNGQLYPEILATCSLFYKEGISMLYCQNAFMAKAPADFDDYPISPQQTKFLCDITHIVFDCPTVAEHFARKPQCIELNNALPALQTVICIAEAFDTLERPDGITDSETWRESFDAFRKRQPLLKRLELRLQQPQDEFQDHNSEYYFHPHYENWLGQSQLEPPHKDPSLSTNSNRAGDHGRYAYHPESKHRLPLNFDEHRRRMALACTWLRNDIADLEWRFQTFASKKALPRVFVHAIVKQKPSTTILCEVVGQWGHMSRVEEL